MTFRDALVKKIALDGLVQRIRSSMTAETDRPDRKNLAMLLAESAYEPSTTRDLDVYIREEEGELPDIVVLDNGLGRYRTTLDDVALRKSPTVKEMISFTNARKILSDSDVLVSRREKTLDFLHRHCIDRLNLNWTRKDIAAIADEGWQAMETRDAKGVETAMTLFSELLSFSLLPDSWRKHGWFACGRQEKEGAKIRVENLTAFCRSHFRIFLCKGPLIRGDKTSEEMVESLYRGDRKGDYEGREVWTALLEAFSDYRP
ncbi:hypothetical protein OOT00_04060 [Desulfobotulus sp. H1]|uniref:Uncharacterized protein n=1 Tax=Desulfobotulus pelophilus TaxID=2823377 RepID=A0ABT3N6S2_9BACT|nr:hypothetical protein [Desulfobotulus pelophilus]MCW7753157.1 hypothetical protein [Desulfobotulus pelophilus]